MVGSICQTIAHETGSGGPIQALICTQILYQTCINAIFFDQALSSFQIAGLACGIAASLMITLGENLFAMFSTKQMGEQEEEPMIDSD